MRGGTHAVSDEPLRHLPPYGWRAAGNAAVVRRAKVDLQLTFRSAPAAAAALARQCGGIPPLLLAQLGLKVGLRSGRPYEIER